MAANAADGISSVPNDLPDTAAILATVLAVAIVAVATMVPAAHTNEHHCIL